MTVCERNDSSQKDEEPTTEAKTDKWKLRTNYIQQICLSHLAGF